MKRLCMAFVVVVAVLFSFSGNSNAEVFTAKGVKLFIGGQADIRPGYFYNVDLDDDDVGYKNYLDGKPSETIKDKVMWEGGYVKSTDFVTEAEVCLTFRAIGDKWGFFIMPMAKFHYNKRVADRDYPDAYEANQWGIERLRLWYDFSPHFKFATGVTLPDPWLDIVGGLVHVNDDFFIRFYGDITENLSWDFTFLDIFEDYGTSYKKFSNMLSKGDWYAYWTKFRYKWNKGKFNGFIEPFLAYSDFCYWVGGPDSPDNVRYYTADVWYPGLEGKLNYGKWTFAFEVTTAQGSYDQDKMDGDMDVDAWAWMWYVKYNYSKSFQPYIGMYYWSGDDDPFDDDIEGWVAMSAGEQFAEFATGPFSIPRDLRGIGGALGSPLYGWRPMGWVVPQTGQYSLDKLLAVAMRNLGHGSDPNRTMEYYRPYGEYGGDTGVNPGAYFVGLGAQGAIGKWFYKAYGYYYWFDEEDCLEKLAYYATGRHVNIDSSLAWGFDSMVSYQVNSNFSMGMLFEVIDPVGGMEDWIDDVLGGNASTGFRVCATLRWKF